MHSFGLASNEKLNTCHPDMQRIMRTAIAWCPVDFGIAEGYRNITLQQLYYAQGKSKIDGIKVKGKHNYSPSMAADIYLWINGKASWNAETMSYVAGFIEAVALMLWMKGTVKHIVRWGGNWDGDGEILTDQKFDDRPHFELIFKVRN